MKIAMKALNKHAPGANESLFTNRTDGATVLDTKRYMCKLNTREAGTKIIKRANGTFEKQYRQNLGKLVIAYRWDAT